jgi:outer membrane autotransporter protein
VLINTLNQSGNTLTLGGFLRATTVNLSGGTITGTGDIDAPGTFTFTGGTISTTGAILAATLVVNNSAGNLDLSNFVVTAGAGSLIKDGAGQLTLGGTNTYGGSTTINAGTVKLSIPTNTLPQTTALIMTGGTLDLNGTRQTVASLAGSGGTISLTTNSRLTVGDGTSTSFAGAITGPGNLVKQGSGALTLTGNNTYTGGTSFDAGTIGAGSDTALGTGVFNMGNGTTLQAAGNVSLANRIVLTSGNGTVDTNGNSLTLSGIVSGAQLTKIGAGTLTLSGNNAYGATVLNAGTLAVGSDTALGTGAFSTLNMANGTTLQAAGNVSLANAIVLTGSDTVDTNGKTLTLSGAVSGGGGLTKIGGGTLTLSNTNTYTGATAINAGTLALNGSIAGSATVASGATIMGTGTVGGALTVNGTIAPGNSIGTLNVTGAFVQNAGSTYAVEVNSAGQSDKINVTGAATINGGTVAVQAASGSYARNTTYTILTASGGRTGTYSAVTSNFAFLTPSLSYDANDVFLTLVGPGSGVPGTGFAAGARTSNQRAVGTALDQASTGATGDFNTVINALSVLSTSQGPLALDAIGGQNYSGFSSLMVQGAQLFMDSFSLHAGGGGGSGSAGVPGGGSYMALKAAGSDACEMACETEALWGVWGGGLGAFGTVAGDGNSSGLTYNLGGFAGGIDRRFAPTFKAGVATGFNAATLYTNGMPGTGTSNTLQFALYGELTEGPFYLDALGGYAHSDNRMTRPLVIPGLPFRSAQGYTTANTFFGQLEGGYKLMVAPTFGGFVTPFARLQASTSTQDAFSESGADSLNLTVAAQTTQSLRTVFGAQLGAGIDAPWREKLNMVFRLGWSHEFADTTRPVTASFAGAPALGFTTFGSAAPRDGVVLGLGANTAIAEATSLYFRYDGDLAGGNTNHVLSAGVRFTW